jgi:ATP-binding cassette, subfamily B, bacterial PglK
MRRQGLSLLPALWRLLDRRQRRRLLALQALTIAMAFSTVGGIAAVIPFFTALSSPAFIHRNRALHALFGRLHFASDASFVMTLGVAFAGAVLLANAINLCGALAIQSFSLRVGDSLYVRLFEEYLHRGYEFHARNNSAALAARIAHDTARVSSGILQHGLLLVANAVTIAFILASIVLLDPLVAAGAVLGLGASYAATYAAARARLLRNGQLESRYHAERTRTVNEALSAIQEVSLLQVRGFFIRRFAAQCAVLSRSTLSTFVIAQSPRYVLEAVTVACLVGIALYLGAGSGRGGPWIAQLSFVGFAAYRLLPALQQAFASLVRMRADRPAFAHIIADLARSAAVRQGAPAAAEVLAWRGRPAQALRLWDVSFRYSAQRHPAVRRVSLLIPAGSIIGLIGPNGSGKSTLVALVSGLLMPQSGRIEIDGIALDDGNVAAWQTTIAYVPQDAVILDATAAENIALGIEPACIDQRKVEAVARLVRLDRVLEALPGGYGELLGERGCRLSGGQRQRLSLARALYRDASVLILDEATSALDSLAEAEIVDALCTLEPRRTVIMISHRLSSLRHCEALFELANGALVRSGTYAELVSSRRHESATGVSAL